MSCSRGSRREKKSVRERAQRWGVEIGPLLWRSWGTAEDRSSFRIYSGLYNFIYDNNKK